MCLYICIHICVPVCLIITIHHLGNSSTNSVVTCSPFVCAAGFVLYLMDLTFRLAQQMHWAPASPASKVSQHGSLATLSLRWHHVRFCFASSKCGFPCLSSSSFLALPASRVSALLAGVCLLFQQVFPCLSSRLFASQANLLGSRKFSVPLQPAFPCPSNHLSEAFQQFFPCLSSRFLGPFSRFPSPSSRCCLPAFAAIQLASMPMFSHPVT